MFTMVLGLLLVGVSAAVFGLALFGRRPQPVTAPVSAPVGVAVAEADLTLPGEPAQVPPTAASDSVLSVGRVRRAFQREPSADHQPVVRFTPWLRIRSTLVLTLVVLGTGALLGVLLTVVIVGAVFVLT